MSDFENLGVIPARYASSRFPGKPLVDLCGIPMVIRVADITAKAIGKENVVVATEDDRIRNVADEFGYKSVMTSDTALTGTDRVWEVAQQISAECYLNIQGDEPILNFEDIQLVAEMKREFPGKVVNGMAPIDTTEDPNSVNIPKVAVNELNDLLYMSRAAIPGSKLPDPSRTYMKQVCIYAFNFEELKKYGEFGRKSDIEQIEDIEILRFMELGVPVRMVETSGSSRAVDVPDDVKVVEQLLDAKS